MQRMIDAEIKTLEGREMLVGLISPPVTEVSLFTTFAISCLCYSLICLFKDKVTA